jgi:hypothetical protein
MERIVEGEDPSPSDTLVRRVPVSDTHYCSTPIWHVLQLRQVSLK